MGAFFCCFHVREERDNATSNHSSSDDCLCPRCFFQKFMNKAQHQNLLTGISSNHRPESSSNSEMVFNISSHARGSGDGTACIASWYLQEKCDEARARQEKITSHSQVLPEPASHSDVQVIQKSAQRQKIVASNSEVGLQDQDSESSVKLVSLGVESRIADAHPSSDDEDVCPTCLEEYSKENPKIIAQCSHHYHLSCIYEWMERSENCPACDKLMLFDESS